MPRTIRTEIQKRFSDIDSFRHVNNVSQQMYFDVGKSDFFDRLLGPEILFAPVRIITAATDTSYMGQIRFEDRIAVTTCVERIGTKSLTLLQRIVADDGTVYYHCDRCGKISTMDMPFVDVDDTDWFAEAVYYCYQNSLLRGRSEMSFDPDAAMTRAELVTVLWRIAGSPNSDNVGKTPFTDVPAGSWYTAAVNWCSENKIVNGIGDGLFAPDDQITREQIVTILYRFAKFRGLDVGDTTDLAKKFTDAARVSDYAKEALSWAVAVGIINGMPDNTIAPQNSATRAEVATIIMRYTKLVSGTEN